MANISWTPESNWASLLKNTGAKASHPAALEGLPLLAPEGFYSILARATGCCKGDVVLSQLDARAATAATLDATAGATVFLVHSDIRIIREAFQELSRRNLGRSVVYFHGRLREFLREIPIRPAIAAVANGAELLDLWDALPARALLLVAETFPAEDRWVAEGYLERIPSCERVSLFQTTTRFRLEATQFPARLQRQLRADLLGRYFGTAAIAGSTYTPVSELTEDARKWWRMIAEQCAGGYEEWPYRDVASTRLPETLPNGERWPLVSIVTPSFNQGQYLEETILSVQRQNYPRIEHIVMDGGSKDETLSIMARYRANLAAAVSEKDRGQAHAINKGMALATGDILTWLNSDDMLAPGALGAIAIGFHLSRADVVAGIVYLRSNNQFVDSHMTCCEPGPLPLDRILDLDGGWNSGQFFYQPEVMFSRQAWERAGGTVREDLYYSMDYDLWVRMAETGAKLHVIGRPTAWFRVHEEQKTSVAEKFMAELHGYVQEYNAKHNRIPPPRPAQLPERRKLRILMLNDHGFKFGAGIAHQRTAESLMLAGHEVDAAAFLPEPGHHGKPSDLSSEDIRHSVKAFGPDLIIAGNIHSATHEPWHLGALAEEFPTLAVLHDFWMLTGRCAYPNPCGKHLTGCDETCPTADQYPKLDPHRIAGVWQQKQRLLFSQTQLALLGNSSWTCQQAEKFMATTGAGRPNLPVVPFRLSFPIDVFRPRDRRTCRSRLGLPEDRFIVVLSGDLYDKRKNTQLALRAVEALELPNVTVISLGYVMAGESFAIDVRRPGHLNDPDLLAAYYAAADVLVAPSAEETFGQVFIEAAACGTAVVGIRGSGMQEAVVDGVTGILVDEISIEALGAAILELYRRPKLRQDMGDWGRIYVENEWSPEASYYHMFQAWRRLGLLDKLGVQPKIAFQMSPRKAPEARLITQLHGITVTGYSMGVEEGPFPEYNLPVFRWAYGPVSKIKLHAPSAGAYSLVIRYRNLHEDQRVSVSFNSRPAGEFPMTTTGMTVGKMLCVAAKLDEGVNEVTLQFAKWMDASIEGRPLAAVITEIFLLPEGSQPEK